MSAKTLSRSSRNKHKGVYAKQRTRTERNKRIRQEKHKQLHPNDKQTGV